MKVVGVFILLLLGMSELLLASVLPVPGPMVAGNLVPPSCAVPLLYEVLDPGIVYRYGATPAVARNEAANEGRNLISCMRIAFKADCTALGGVASFINQKVSMPKRGDCITDSPADGGQTQCAYRTTMDAYCCPPVAGAPRNPKGPGEE